MRIAEVRTHLITSRWQDDPFNPTNLHSAALVQILTDDGLSGLGETIVGYFAPETVPTLVDFYKPLLIGQDPQRINQLWSSLWTSSIYWGRSGSAISVLSGIEMALWDLKAKALGVPLYQLLGGLARESLPVYCSGGPALWPVERTVEKCQYYVEQGYRAVKFATGYYIKEGNPELPTGWKLKAVPSALLGTQEAEKIAAVRQAVGPEIDIILDGHQGGIANPYSLADAQRVVEAIVPYGVLFFEEPLPYTDPQGYAELRRMGKVAIAGGESLASPYEFHQFLEEGGLDIVQPEVTFAGGISAVAEICKQAAVRNLRSALHCGGSVGPGLAASVHLSFANDSCLTLEHLLCARSVQNDFMLEPLVPKDGTILPPTAPGLGVQIDDALLEKYPYVPGTGEVT